ncbi:hypothetical protein Ocin01_10913 [Orchesella cincta]|uniref:Glycine N-acyltransferase-like protein n=1 Tax=Orchesella cincta TaxID=48709 RepID=A0A1D2MSS2_ORCCI|nr:hypothetical protein Ocin01_10913 [Orchesella cincta]
MRTHSPDPFIQISDTEIPVVQNVLKQRLPISAHEYNMVLSKKRFRQDVQVCTMDGDLSDNAIILLTTFRQDYGLEISMSIPPGYLPDEYLRQALISTTVIDWDDAFVFISVPRPLSMMIFEISTVIKHNSTTVNPNYQYVFDTTDSTALHQNFRNLNDGIEIRPLDKTIGAKFLLDNWKYTKDGTPEYVQKVLDKNPSAGVFVDGKLACGALVNVHGLIGLLYTDNHYRRMGLAQLCMRFLFKEMAKIGQVPCSTSQSKNDKSTNFHEKLGMVVTHETDYIFHIPYSEAKFNT